MTGQSGRFGSQTTIPVGVASTAALSTPCKGVGRFAVGLLAVGDERFEWDIELLPPVKK